MNIGSCLFPSQSFPSFPFGPSRSVLSAWMAGALQVLQPTRRCQEWNLRPPAHSEDAVLANPDLSDTRSSAQISIPFYAHTLVCVCSCMCARLQTQPPPLFLIAYPAISAKQDGQVGSSRGKGTGRGVIRTGSQQPWFPPPAPLL